MLLVKLLAVGSRQLVVKFYRVKSYTQSFDFAGGQSSLPLCCSRVNYMCLCVSVSIYIYCKNIYSKCKYVK